VLVSTRDDVEIRGSRSDSNGDTENAPVLLDDIVQSEVEKHLMGECTNY
jgi:hypothetical protein